MPNDDTHKPPEADDIAPKSAPLRWLQQFIHGFKILTGLSLVTVLSSVAVGYFQYINAYQEKVSSQAKEDMTLAAATFTEISRAFSEMQALQQTLYADFARAVGEKSDASDKALVTRNARSISERYEKAGIELREVSAKPERLAGNQG
jgi:AAA+ ATPase superfamily predicted ATPase